MKHVFVVLDNDALLYACWNREHAERTIEREQRRIDNFTKGASAEDKSRIEQAHYLHHVMIPVSTYTKE